MSEPLYFIFGLPAFEIELKNRKLMVNHKEVKFNGENYSFYLGLTNIVVGSLCISKSRHDLGEILLRYKKSRASRRDLANRGEM